MKEKDCIFCKLTEREIPSQIIFENELDIAFLDIFPISEGHTIVIPKKHYSNLEYIPDYELTELFKVVKKLAIMIHKKLKIDGYNILQNNFTAAGQVINHFHVHIIPRNFDDEKFRIKIPGNQSSEEELNKIYRILKS
ncbi:MAG: HIT family protein [Promethearchaeota archaeon Loki_b32]|nr:MAG: HIT family protein [Candidatus Lokiarchaeota archaeon Loki_b32]